MTTKVRTTVEDWDTLEERHLEHTVSGESLDTVEVSYDEGRLYVSVNGKDILQDTSGMSDFTLTLWKV